MPSKFKNYDCAGDDAPKMSSGVDPFDNPGIDPSESPIKDTPGETATNDVSQETWNKAQPFKCKGSGYGNC